MDQPVGRITQLRLYPIRPLWSLGPGWAAVIGGLAAGGFALSPEILLNLLLVWLLADPLLGVVWDLGIGDSSSWKQTGIWLRLLTPRLPAGAPSQGILPYTQPGSPSRWVAQRLGQMLGWWQDTFWPEAGQGFATLVAALGLALLLGAVLGRNVLLLVIFSAVLSWLAALSQGRAADRTSPQRATSRQGIVTLWRALGEFGIPWLIGAVVLGRPSWAVIALGTCYIITYFGLIQNARAFQLIAASQATSALLLAGLRHPLAAGATLILLLPQWGLHLWADYPTAPRSYLPAVQPFIILGMLVAALAVAM